MDVTERHLSDEETAAAVDGRFREGAREHLARCRRCFAAYAEAAEVTADWLATAEPTGASQPQEASGAGRSRTAWSWFIPGGIAAAAAVVSALLLFPRDEPFRPSPTLVAAVDSYPGVRLPRSSGPESRPPTRGAGGPHPSQTLAAAESLSVRWRAAPSKDIGYWRAAGFLVAGQRRAAALSLEEALARFPNDVELRVLQAELARLDGRPEDAVRLLQEALRLDPRSRAARDALEQASRTTTSR